MTSNSDESQRHSIPESAEVFQDPEEQAKAEAANGVRQFDTVRRMIDEAVDPERPFKLRPSHILTLHREALQGISSYAGGYRPAEIEIGGSKHEPVGAHLVPEKIELLCDYVNENWEQTTPVHLASYVMWRLNWIHPFTDGNGRTSRALSYMILCARMGSRLPGGNTIPDQISENKTPYYKALEAADTAWDGGKVDVSKMEELIGALLAAQLAEIHNVATGSGS